jgi:hypothetical protein
MVIDMTNPTQLTQSVTIFTDRQRADSSIVCPITANLAPADTSNTFASLSSNFDLITVSTEHITTPLHYGSHSFTLTVNSLDYSSDVAPQTYTFNVIIKCSVSSL